MISTPDGLIGDCAQEAIAQRSHWRSDHTSAAIRLAQRVCIECDDEQFRMDCRLIAHGCAAIVERLCHDFAANARRLQGNREANMPTAVRPTQGGTKKLNA
jgi:hypothetical protein